MKIDLFGAHAYLIRTTDAGVVIDVLTDQGVVTKGNPDFYSLAFDQMGVDDTRAVVDYASLAPLGDRKYIVIAAKRMTEEAQSALLKVVEDATGRSIFFFITEPGASILPTLASRCVTLKMGDSKQRAAGTEFLKLDYKDRLALAEKFAKNHDREGARALVRSLLALADEQRFDKEILHDLLDADRYLALSGSSPKGVIGHLALVL